MQHFYDFFRNADFVRVVSSSSGSRQSQATKFISCMFEAIFYKWQGLLRRGMAANYLHFKLGADFHMPEKTINN